MQFRVSNEHTQKKVSLYEDDDDANDIRVERERERRTTIDETSKKGALRFGPTTTLCERKRRRRSPLERVLLQQRISFLGVVFLECDYSSRKR